MIFTELKYKYLLSKTVLRVCNGAKCKISDRANLTNSKIIVSSGARLSIANDVSIDNVEIYLEKGSFAINEFSILKSEVKNTCLIIIINNGNVVIGNHSKISCKRIWVRFGGILKIGDYTNINCGSEIRCDNAVRIGSYVQISYNVKIWDTNTHNILDSIKRREIAEKYYPYFGYEEERPSTKPVVIGNDCWIGENAALLKGTSLGDGSIVGYNTIIPGYSIPSNCTVVQDIKLKIIGPKN